MRDRNRLQLAGETSGMRNQRFKLPLHLVALDAAGALLAMLGLFEWLSESSVVPDDYKFENYPIAMMVVGGLLMAPLIVHVVKHALSGSERAP